MDRISGFLFLTLFFLFFSMFESKPFKHVTLARWGGLSMVRQRKNYGNDTFHSAPERYGFYAFVFPYIELFLIGSTKNKEFQEGTYKKFTLKGGFIWTHLKPFKSNEIFDTYGSWYKIRVEYLPKLYAKYFAIETGCSYARNIYGFDYKENNKERIKKFYSPMNKSPYIFTSKDHLEVFVCRETKF